LNFSSVEASILPTTRQVTNKYQSKGDIKCRLWA